MGGDKVYDCGFTKGNHWFRFRTGGIIIKDNKMLFVKNFFKGVGGAIDGFDCHTMEFYYLMTIQEDCVDTNRKETDEGEELVWVPIEEILDSVK